MIDIVSTDKDVIFKTQADKQRYLADLSKKVQKAFEKAEEIDKEKIMKIVMKSRHF